MSDWRTIRRHAEDTGYTEDAIRAKIASGAWPEGVVWRKRDGRIHISARGYDAWVEGRESELSGSRSRSTSNIRVVAGNG